MENLINALQSLNAANVIAPEINYSEYVALNLSVHNSELSKHKLETAQDYEKFIQNHLNEQKAKIAFGGYLEKRNLYKRSSVFKNDKTEERTIHIGLDLWINQKASIHAALEGTIHSFQNNTALGDYGPTLILEHSFQNLKFHTLYGHLSEESLIGKK